MAMFELFPNLNDLAGWAGMVAVVVLPHLPDTRGRDQYEFGKWVIDWMVVLGYDIGRGATHASHEHRDILLQSSARIFIIEITFSLLSHSLPLSPPALTDDDKTTPYWYL